MAFSGGVEPGKPRPFIYVSAEDIFRPVIPAKYIETKREAERAIERMMSVNSQFRSVYIRPSRFMRLNDLVYFMPKYEFRRCIPCLSSSSDNSGCSISGLVGNYP